MLSCAAESPEHQSGPLHKAVLIATMLNVCGLWDAQQGCARGNGGVPAATCSVWPKLRVSPLAGISCPKPGPPSSGPVYASDTRSVASEGFQNLSPVRRLRPSRIAWLDSLASLTGS